jgi:hypothetical protein
LWTVGSSWFSNDAGKKGSIEPGQLADLAVLSKDFFEIPEEEIKSLESVLTIVGGRIVYASEDYKEHAPPELPISPDWSPVKTFADERRRETSKTVSSHNYNRAACGHDHRILTQVKAEVKDKFDVFGSGWGFACGCAF